MCVCVCLCVCVCVCLCVCLQVCLCVCLCVFVWLTQRGTGDNTILVRALDRFHRRLQAMNKLLPDTDFSK